jgi:hypothetical protein
MLLLVLVTITSMDPARSRGFMVKVESAVPADPAVGGSQALKGRLGRPGEGTLLRSELREEVDDFIHGKYCVVMIFIHCLPGITCYFEHGAQQGAWSTTAARKMRMQR